MRKRKVMTIVGTRPEIIRLSACIKACDRYFDHVLVHTGQNYDYELNQVFFEELELRKPDHYLEAAQGSLGETIGNIIAKSYEVLAAERPEALLILGDTNSCLAAIAAKRLKIPVFHMEAGNRCFDENLPEEINRRIVDHISDVNLPYTEHSRRYLLSEGVAKERVFVTGSPMAEVLNGYREKIESSDVLQRLGLTAQKYILVSAHREENVDNAPRFQGILEALNGLAAIYNIPIIYSVHPRSRKRIEETGFSFDPRVQSLKPFGFFDYNKLQQNALAVLSDSGTLPEESAILGFCGVSLRDSTERPEAIDKGTMLVGGVTSKDIIRATEMAIALWEDHRHWPLPPDYADLNVSEKVVRIIEGYTKVVNEFVWRKN